MSGVADGAFKRSLAAHPTVGPLRWIAFANLTNRLMRLDPASRNRVESKTMSSPILQSRFIAMPLLAALTCGGAIAAQPESGIRWSGDPSSNLIVADRSGEETQAKILPRADGGFYVSWFDNTDGGYDVRLQRLDANGTEVWAHNGILVSDRSYGSTTDYGFSVDTAGNAILSFQCCAATSDESVLVYKIDESGTSVWGAGGVTVTTPTEDVLVSYVTATSDGNVVAAWMNGSAQGRAQKLDANGTPMWGSTGITLPGPATGFKFIADIKAGLNGDAIVAWSNQAGSTRILRAQKLASADGAVLWGNDGVRVSDAGNLQAGYFPKIISDGAGGAIFAYYDIAGVAALTRVQHLDATGARLLGNDGVLVTTDTTNKHINPAAVFDATTGDIHVVWIDTFVATGGMVFDGLYAQRIDSTGGRSYGDTGKEIVPMTNSTDGTNGLSQTIALNAPAGFIAGWVTGSPSAVNNAISAVRLNGAGNLLWNQPTQLKTSITKTSRLTAATSEMGYAAFVWSDSPSNDSTLQNVRAQNLQYDGGFINDRIFSNGFDD